MPFYMFQASYTPASIKAMIGNPQDRSGPAKAMADAVGGTLHDIFFCMGSDDIVAIMEAADDETAAAVSMAIGGSGGFSAGRLTKLLTMEQGVSAMQKAGTAAAAYAPPGS